MKRLFCILTIALSFNLATYSQIIDDPIPKFAESLLALNKNSAKKHLSGCNFRLLSNDDLKSLGYDQNSISKTIVGIGDYNITCKVQTSDNGQTVEKVTVGGVKYLNAKYMVNEYENAGYLLNEDESTRSELCFLKRTSKYIYIAFVEFAITPNTCMTNAKFSRVVNKHYH